MQIGHKDIFGFWNKVCHKKEPNGLINGSKTDLVWDAKNQYTHPYLSLSLLHYFDFNILSVRAQIQNDLGGREGEGEEWIIEGWSRVEVKFSGRLYVYKRYKEVVNAQKLNKYTK